MTNLEIMVVDDSALTIKKLGAMLEQLGHQVSKTCKSGMEAVETFKYLKDKGLPRPDLVTMDITMPEMDGIAATSRILAMDPDALIIMVTSHGQEQMVIEAIEAGAKGYVLKPFKIEKLKESINQVITRYKKE
ncbi:response regulator [Desulfurivibrio alkaliphilus]|uniref:Response regulator receiver protein n=1 Tax=Desulfurivibrio alkaliphilus (strain DSM 19089 / UNIQEM U267 / AHT2) TaxID=589865 RepID=D6Z1C0_DESAT|nr:response regulator [Desulfurivibrio alkaliphilus]ADH85375.1 response regulator receiver protein [Desulfurivibrio alkaliphilus AHT 2]